VSPFTVIGEDVPVAVKEPGVDVTVYKFAGESELDGIKLIDADGIPPYITGLFEATTPIGADGFVITGTQPFVV